MKELRLTSPNMKCPEAGVAQKILKQKGYYTAKIDSIYGEKSASAAKAAKWDLGYAEKDINSSFDFILLQYLNGDKKPGLVMRQRAKARRKKQSLGEAALGVAHQFVGVSEDPPGSNKVMFSNWYGMNGPWCAMFVTYCFTQAKSKAFLRGSKYAYCPYMLAAAKAQKDGLQMVPVQNVRAGDVVLFDWKGDGVADHVGIVKVAPGSKKTFTSIEGNTSGTNPSDGGMVAVMERNVSSVIGFIRVIN